MTDTTDDFTPASEQEEQDDLTAVVPPVERWTPPPVPPNWLPPVQQSPQPYQQPQVLPKSPAVAVIASLLIPGLGSMISGNAGIGVLILILYIVGVATSWLLIGIPLAIACWIWGMVNAHGSAVAWNRKHGILS